MNKAVIALGSNIDPQKNIAKAKDRISQRLKILSESSFVTTEPVGIIKQANFINGALLVETDLKLDELKSQLQGIETVLGRTIAGHPFGPRTIDLDIVVFNDQIVHQDFYARDYLKQSVLELLPQLTY